MRMTGSLSSSFPDWNSHPTQNAGALKAHESPAKRPTILHSELEDALTNPRRDSIAVAQLTPLRFGDRWNTR